MQGLPVHLHFAGASGISSRARPHFASPFALLARQETPLCSYFAAITTVSAATPDVSAWRTTGSEPISADPYHHITSRDSYGVHQYPKAIEISALPQEREQKAERNALCRPSSCPARSRSIGNHGSDRGQMTHFYRSWTIGMSFAEICKKAPARRPFTAQHAGEWITNPNPQFGEARLLAGNLLTFRTGLALVLVSLAARGT